MASVCVKESLFTTRHCKTVLSFGLFLYILLLLSFSGDTQLFLTRWGYPNVISSGNDVRTNLSHIAFGLMASVPTWPHRKGYSELWWRPNKTRGYVFLDRPPPPELLPWPQTAPPYRVVDNLTQLFTNTKPRYEQMPRIVHGILELLREEHDGVRWIVMGDDDSFFFLDNVVDVLAEYDHTKYYYLGWPSEYVKSNYWYSFDQAFGGGGVVLSYPLARVLAKDMDRCLIQYAQSYSSDHMIMTCIADIGVTLTPHKGIHQVDLHGDISGYLSAHPKVPVMSLHHFDIVDPIFPSKDRKQSTRHLMKAAEVDQSRLLQQSICHHRQNKWSFSIAWGYSAQIYEMIHPRSFLQIPLETFLGWTNHTEQPLYMFNTRRLSNDSCDTPHFFFLESVTKSVGGDQIVTTYSRARPRGLPPCLYNGGHSADSMSKIQVFSPAKKRLQIDKSECCDVVRMDGVNADVRFRECKIDEIIA